MASFGTPSVTSLSPYSPTRGAATDSRSMADRLGRAENEIERIYEILGGVSPIPGASSLSQGADAYFYWEC